MCDARDGVGHMAASVKAARRPWFAVATALAVVGAACTAAAPSRPPITAPMPTVGAGRAVVVTPGPVVTVVPVTPVPVTPVPAAPTPAPVAAPTPLPTPAPTAAPPQRVEIGFGDGYRETGSNVALVGQGSTFTAGEKMAWRMRLPSAPQADEVRVTFTRVADGVVVQEFVFDAGQGSNVFYGEAAYVKRPGSYLMRTYADDYVIGEGAFQIKPAPQPTPDPTPRPTPRPTRGGGGGGGGDCDRQSYPGVCIPEYPPDLDCGDIPFSFFRVRPPDPHGFDGEGDGVGCES